MCVFSNVVVDELVLCLKGGVKIVGGKVRKINVLCLGWVEVINVVVKDVFLDEFVWVCFEGDIIKEKVKEV